MSFMLFSVILSLLDGKETLHSVSFVRVCAYMNNVCRFYFHELMKLGCKGNCCAFIYPRCSDGMTQNLHTVWVVFGAITLC